MIVFNGVEYASVSEMPEDVRRQYERLMRKDRSGSEPGKVPEALEGTADSEAKPGKIASPDGEMGNLDKMPPRVRKLFESLNRDSDGNGIPDVFEPGGEDLVIPEDVKTVSRKISVRREIVNGKEVISEIVVDGKKYASEEEMPPEVKKVYADFLARVDADGDGTPEVFQGEREGSIGIAGPGRIEGAVPSTGPIVVESEGSRSARVKRLEKTVAILIILVLILMAYIFIAK